MLRNEHKQAKTKYDLEKLMMICISNVLYEQCYTIRTFSHIFHIFLIFNY